MHQRQASCLRQGWRLEKGFLGEIPAQGQGICLGWFHHGNNGSEELFAVDLLPPVTAAHSLLHLPIS